MPSRYHSFAHTVQFCTVIRSQWNLILATFKNDNVNTAIQKKKMDLSNKLELSTNACSVNVANVTSKNQFQEIVAIILNYEVTIVKYKTINKRNGHSCENLAYTTREISVVSSKDRIEIS